MKFAFSRIPVGGDRRFLMRAGVSRAWARSGRELFYRSQSGVQMMVVEVQTEPSFSAGTPRLLFDGTTTPAPELSLTTMSQQTAVRETGMNQINIVLNWFDELKRFIPTD